MDQGHFLFLDDKFLRTNAPVISADNRSFRYGDGFFATIKYMDGKMQLASFQLDRIMSTLKIMEFKVPIHFSAHYIQNAISALLKKNGHSKIARVRCNFFRGDGGIYDEQNHFPHLMIQSWPLSNTCNKLNINGLDIGIYNNAVKSLDLFSNLKTNNYLPYSMGAIWAKQNYLNDALILNQNKCIADSTIANLFMVKDGKLITPPLSDGPVAGVMRRAIIEYADSFGIEVEETSILPVELLKADEIFLTNAIFGIKYVKSFGNKQYSQRFVESFFYKLQQFFHE